MADLDYVTVHTVTNSTTTGTTSNYHIIKENQHQLDQRPIRREGFATNIEHLLENVNGIIIADFNATKPFSLKFILK